MNKAAQLLQLLATIKGARFANFTYTSKGTGEVARYTVNLAVDFGKLYEDDKATLKALKGSLVGIELQAATELLDSIEKSLKVGIGNNPNYTNADTYTSVPNISGVKVHNETGELHIMALVEQKEVLVQGVYKTVNSRPLTLAKRAIEKNLRRSKIRQFVLPNLSRAALQGEVVTFE